MTPNKRTILATALTLAAIGTLAPAQRVDRLSAGIHGNDKIRFRGSRNARIEKLTDGGPVDDSMRVAGISFRFRPTEAQQAELDRLLEEQQNPWSPLHHAWLTPEEFGDRFGLGGGDFATVRAWVESQGFRVDDAARSRTFLTFSGTAAQVRQAFLTDLHRFQVNGQPHYANIGEAAVPRELAPLIFEVSGLDDLPMSARAGSGRQANLDAGKHALGPRDLAVIYNAQPLWESGIDGTGQTIAVAGKTSFKMTDVQIFRSVMGLSKNDPKMILVPGHPDPGILESDVDEALLNVQYASGSAPNATTLYVYGRDPRFAAQHVIDRNLAPVISYSYLVCEGNVSTVDGAASWFRNLAQQASAQGITWVASPGDSGPSACESHSEKGVVGESLSAGVPASLPEVTAVGGTRFDEKPGVEYWLDAAGPGRLSARSYIPEKAWNDSEPDKGLAASGGGVSSLYPRPVWQSVGGTHRQVPDIAFAASWDHVPYLVVKDGAVWAGGGTSAATPFFAGIVTMLNQYMVKTGAQARPGLGNINPRLYQLAQSTPSVFHDITAGDNIIPCKTGTPGCVTGKYGYTAGPGYDLVTGLGSIDVKNLFDNWIETKKASSVATSLALAAAPSTIAADRSAVLTATVKAASGKDAPGGTVIFRAGSITLGSSTLQGKDGTATAAFSVAGRQLATGANTITAAYPGSGGFEASSGSVVVTVPGPPSGSAVEVSVTPNPVYRQDPDEDGYEWYYTVEIKETAGIATRLTSFFVEEYDLSESIVDWFGTANLAANGTLSVKMRSSELEVPVDVVFAFAGVDGNGQKWTKKIAVPFLGKREGGASGPSAAMSLTSVPAVVVKVGKGDPNCSADRPYYQKLVLQEQNGVDVQLTRFMAGGNNYTGNIGAWFGSTKLPGKGTLTAGLCWQLDSVPVTLQYQMDGTDQSGKPVRAELSVDFKSLDQKSGDELLSASHGVNAQASLGNFAPVKLLRKLSPNAAGRAKIARRP